MMLLGASLLVFTGCKRKGCTTATAVNYDEKAKKDDGSCVYDDDDSQLPDEYVFSQELMIEHIGNNIILPRLTNAKNDVTDLNTAILAFATAPDLINLTAAQTAFVKAYKSYQRIEMLQFGPGEEEMVLRTYANTFPTDTAGIIDVIANGTVVDFEVAAYLDHNGFPALDYLLYKRAENDLVAWYADSANVNAVNYLKQVSEDLLSTITTLETAWLSTGGNYIATFKANATKTDAGSSLSLLTNQFSLVYENTKTYRLLVPLGTLDVMPHKCEAYFSGISKDLIVEQLDAVSDLYYGKFETSGVDSIGFEEFLKNEQAKTLDGADLNSVITAQFAIATDAANAIPDPMSQALIDNKAIVQTAYTEFQKNVGYIKRDLTSAIGVMISYSDSDGD